MRSRNQSTVRPVETRCRSVQFSKVSDGSNFENQQGAVDGFIDPSDLVGRRNPLV